MKSLFKILVITMLFTACDSPMAPDIDDEPNTVHQCIGMIGLGVVNTCTYEASGGIIRCTRKVITPRTKCTKFKHMGDCP